MCRSDGIKKITVSQTVTGDKLACSVGSGSLRVYATPMAAALVEAAAMRLAQEYIEADCTTVGTKITVEHMSPTPENAEVTAHVTLKEISGRAFNFTAELYDKKGLIAVCEHTRVSVKAESFQKKAESKFE